MPAFKKAKYSVEQTQEIMMRAFGALCDSETPMTIEEIQPSRFVSYQHNRSKNGASFE